MIDLVMVDIVASALIAVECLPQLNLNPIFICNNKEWEGRGLHQGQITQRRGLSSV